MLGASDFRTFTLTTIYIAPSVCGVDITTLLQSHLISSRAYQSETRKTECKKSDEERTHDASHSQLDFLSRYYIAVVCLCNYQKLNDIIINLNIICCAQVLLKSSHEAPRLLLLCNPYSQCRHLCHFD